MTQPIDTAWVEIKAKGEDSAARDIAKALEKIAAEVKKLTKVIEKEFAEAGREMEGEVQQATKSIEKDFARQSRAAQKTGTSLALAMKEASDSAARSIDDMADDAVNDLERISRQAMQTAATVAMAGRGPGPGHGGGGGGGDFDIGLGRDRDLRGINGSLRGLSGLASGAMSAVRKLAAELSETLGNSAAKAGKALGTLTGIISSAFGPIFSLIGSLGLLGVALLLTPFIIPVVAWLGQLIGLLAILPGSIGFLIAAIAPLIIAFQGIGDAVSALASGDLTKIDQAMQNLAPAARKFAVELFHLRDEMKLLKFTVQEAFFKEFNGSLTELVTRLLPTLRHGLGQVSGSLGRLGADFTDTLSSARAIDAINDLFATTGRIIDDIRGPLMDVIDALLGGMKASLPFVERMFKNLGNSMEKFAKWMNEAIEDGRFEKWLNDAFETMKDLWDLLKALGGLWGALFSKDVADEGKSIIESITESVKELTEYLKSPEGKKQLEDMATAAKDFATAMITVTGWVTAFYDVISKIKDSPFGLLVPTNVIGRFKFFKELWDDLWPKIKDFAGSVGGWFSDAGKSIGDFFGDVGQWFEDTWNTITDRGEDILQWFEDLPGKIGDWLSGIPGTVQNAFVTAFDNATYAVGFGIGAIVKFFMDLPGNIQEGLTNFWNTVTDWFGRTRTSVVDTVTNMWNSVVDWFTRLPGRVSSAVSSIVSNVTKWFNETRERATRAVTNTVNSVIEWFRKLPGRAADAISGLPDRIWKILRRIVTDAGDIGRDIMHGIADGIDRGVNSAINAAVRAAGNILRGFWDALEIGSPSKLMAREVGKPIMQGVGVGVKDNSDEVTRSINTAVNRTVTDTSANAAAVASGGGGGSITIQNLSIPISGTFDLSNPAGARAAALRIYEALEELKRGYR